MHKISKEFKLTSEIIKSSDLLAETYTKLKDFESAVLFQRISKEASQAAGIQEIEKLSERTKSTQQQYEEEAEKAKFNSIWKYVVLVLVLLLAFMGYYVWKLAKTSKANQQLVSQLNKHLKELKSKK